MCLINCYSEKFRKIHRKTHLPQSLFQQFIINKFLRIFFTEHLWISACRKSWRLSANSFVKKQPQEVFCKRGVLKNFVNFTGKHFCLSLFLIKLQACNFVKKRLQHSSFPVHLDKFLKTSLLKSICERLFLFVVSLQAYNFHYRNLDKLQTFVKNNYLYPYFLCTSFQFLNEQVATHISEAVPRRCSI